MGDHLAFDGSRSSRRPYRSHRWDVPPIVKVCCGVLIALSLYGCVHFLAPKPSVPSTLTREERLKMAAEAYSRRQCEKLWDLLWPLAREGDGEALSDLAIARNWGGLLFPAADVETGHEGLANVLAMTIYGAAAPKHPTKGDLHLVLDSVTRSNKVTVVSFHSGKMSYRQITAPTAISMAKLERCLARVSSSAAGDRCVRQAIELGLIPSFSEYRKAVDEILATNRREPCLPLPW
jgi:hypothetical protein